MAIRKLLLVDALSTPETERLDAIARRRFGTRLDGLEPPIAAILGPFVLDAPWRYLADAVFDEAVELLSIDPARTFEAVKLHREAVDRGLAALFRAENQPEDSLNQLRARELAVLANNFFPNYLQVAEHVFGNLLTVFWAIGKKGKVRGRFDLKGAVTVLEQRGRGTLLNGFDDRVRNAIAHGETSFVADGILFRAGIHAKRLASHEFLRLHDDLVRTCNGLASALLVFWGQNASAVPRDLPAPPSLASRVAGAHLNRPGCRVVGAIESDLPLVGRQLNISLRLAERERSLVIGRCFQVAAELLEAGADGYDRFAIEVDQGEPVSSLVLVDPVVLRELLEVDAEVDELPRAIVDTPLLWWNEPRVRSRIRLWAAALREAIRQAKDKVVRDWHAAGLFLAATRYRVRNIEDLSVGGVPRVRVYATLEEPGVSDDPEVILAVTKALVRFGRRRWLFPFSHLDGRRLGLRRRPQIVLVDLFRTDGTLRWLRGGGWLAGNVVAVAERTWSGREHVHVTNPEAEVDGIRFRFQIDAEAADEALGRVNEVIDRVRREHGLD